MPGVLVVARTSGGLTAEAIADGAGIYRFPSLRPDTYELSLDLDGFAPVRITNVALTLGRQLRIDLVLVPAGLNETVNVTAPSPLLAVGQSVRATSLRGDDIDKCRVAAISCHWPSTRRAPATSEAWWRWNRWLDGRREPHRAGRYRNHRYVARHAGAVSRDRFRRGVSTEVVGVQRRIWGIDRRGRERDHQKRR